MRQSRFSSRGFTIVEILIASIIFTVGFAGAYMLVRAGIGLATAEKTEIVASNLLREQHETVKNMRDSNWLQLRHWDSVEPYRPTGETATGIAAGYYYVENDYAAGHSPVRFVRLGAAFDGTQEKVLADMAAHPSAVALCLDRLGRYVHDCAAPGATRTPYGAFLRVEPLVTRGSSGPLTVADGWRFTFSVVSTERGYHRYDLSAILTDWKH